MLHNLLNIADCSDEGEANREEQKKRKKWRDREKGEKEGRQQLAQQGSKYCKANTKQKRMIYTGKQSSI